MAVISNGKIFANYFTLYLNNIQMIFVQFDLRKNVIFTRKKNDEKEDGKRKHFIGSKVKSNFQSYPEFNKTSVSFISF